MIKSKVKLFAFNINNLTKYKINGYMVTFKHGLKWKNRENAKTFWVVLNLKKNDNLI